MTGGIESTEPTKKLQEQGGLSLNMSLNSYKVIGEALGDIEGIIKSFKIEEEKVLGLAAKK